MAREETSHPPQIRRATDGTQKYTVGRPLDMRHMLCPGSLSHFSWALRGPFQSFSGAGGGVLLALVEESLIAVPSFFLAYITEWLMGFSFHGEVFL